MVSVRARLECDRSWVRALIGCQTKYYEIGICCFSAKYATLSNGEYITSWSVFSYIIHFHLQVFSFYIFTFLMFRKLNKPQLTKIKQQYFIDIRAFDSRLYLDISRSFKWKESFIFRYFNLFQVFQMFTCGPSDFLLLAVSCFCIARIHFKSSHTRQFWA